LNIHLDSRNQPYIDVGNLRITRVQNRPEDKDWADEQIYIRVQAYRDPARSEALHRGAEFPLPSPVEGRTLADALIRLGS
jgi:hypothetical protein